MAKWTCPEAAALALALTLSLGLLLIDPLALAVSESELAHDQFSCASSSVKLRVAMALSRSLTRWMRWNSCALRDRSVVTIS